MCTCCTALRSTCTADGTRNPLHLSLLPRSPRRLCGRSRTSTRMYPPRQCHTSYHRNSTRCSCILPVFPVPPGPLWSGRQVRSWVFSWRVPFFFLSRTCVFSRRGPFFYLFLSFSLSVVVVVVVVVVVSRLRSRACACAEKTPPDIFSIGSRAEKTPPDIFSIGSPRPRARTRSEKTTTTTNHGYHCQSIHCQSIQEAPTEWHFEIIGSQAAFRRNPAQDGNPILAQTHQNSRPVAQVQDPGRGLLRLRGRHWESQGAPRHSGSRLPRRDSRASGLRAATAGR